MRIEVLEPWNETSYEQALARQAELSAEGEVGWLLFCCPPTLTLGKRAKPSEVLVSSEALQKLGVERLLVDRGGKVTYHGPGQIIGFPVGSLKILTGNSRGAREFVERLQRTLERFVEDELQRQCSERKVVKGAEPGNTGVWLNEKSTLRKVVAFGMAFSREAIRHGFALNVESLGARFELIEPCGLPSSRVTSLFGESLAPDEFHRTRCRLVEHLVAF